MTKKYIRTTNTVRAPKTPKILLATLSISERAARKRELDKVRKAKSRAKKGLLNQKTSRILPYIRTIERLEAELRIKSEQLVALKEENSTLIKSRTCSRCSSQLLADDIILFSQ